MFLIVGGRVPGWNASRDESVEAGDKSVEAGDESIEAGEKTPQSCYNDMQYIYIYMLNFVLCTTIIIHRVFNWHNSMRLGNV